MTAEQEGAYIRLLCYDWKNDGIPDDQEALSILSRMNEGWLKGGSTKVLKCFQPHPTKNGFLTNPRLQKEREKQEKWKEKSREGGLKSAKTRELKRSKGGSTKRQPHTPTVVQPNGNSSSSSSSSNNTPISPTVPELIWSIAPNTGKSRSSQYRVEQEWSKIPQKERPDEETILSALKAWISSDDWTRENGQFVPGIHRWVKDRKWECPPPPSQIAIRQTQKRLFETV